MFLGRFLAKDEQPKKVAEGSEKRLRTPSEHLNVLAKDGGGPELATTPRDVAKALYGFHSEHPDDLSFDRGDPILILRKDNDYVWTGQNQRTQRQGAFMCKYVASDPPAVPGAYPSASSIDSHSTSPGVSDNPPPKVPPRPRGPRSRPPSPCTMSSSTNPNEDAAEQPAQGLGSKESPQSIESNVSSIGIYVDESPSVCSVRSVSSAFHEPAMSSTIPNYLEDFDADESDRALLIKESNLAAVDTAATHCPVQHQTTPAQFAAAVLTRPFKSNIQKLRAIFFWISQFVQYEREDTPDDPQSVLLKRKSGRRGFAALFQSLAQAAGLDCYLIDGYYKKSGWEIGSTDKIVTNHAWNAVRLGDRTWLIDSALATRSHPLHRHHILDPTYLPNSPAPKWAFDRDFYFLCPPVQLAYTHLPGTPDYQFLATGPISPQTFAPLPIYTPVAYQHRIRLLFDSLTDCSCYGGYIQVPISPALANQPRRLKIQCIDGTGAFSELVLRGEEKKLGRTRRTICQGVYQKALWSPEGSNEAKDQPSQSSAAASAAATDAKMKEFEIEFKTLGLVRDNCDGILNVYLGPRVTNNPLNTNPYSLAMTLRLHFTPTDASKSLPQSHSQGRLDHLASNNVPAGDATKDEYITLHYNPIEFAVLSPLCVNLSSTERQSFLLRPVAPCPDGLAPARVFLRSPSGAQVPFTFDIGWKYKEGPTYELIDEKVKEPGIWQIVYGLEKGGFAIITWYRVR
ncbi:uncharacterized protein BJ171DRAFT_601004 [Polychytrium aggregatum]|uniref:uncharacterized protein n=1 Tax=Polychytrium aggregatum TaxID=110093 RepID=UPI0022FE5290|nr:uncharacterized protein BJ171DRAFT_601004 [Polychytrium aggregatum]KAI9202314.1 hypothetical protein BJ171DRAFT_601004 [Polychytrium aggregatum]